MKLNTCKKAAGVIETYLESIGKQVKFSQALEVVARAHGAPNWNVLQSILLSDSSRKKGEASAADKLIYSAIAANYFNAATAPVCKKCGTGLDDKGWCKDETCPYHDWPQVTPDTALSTLTPDAIEALYGLKKRLYVLAEAYSDDHIFEVEFDAAPWFVQASDAEILALSAIEWGGDAEADDVARHFENSLPEVETLFDYLGRVDMGFECHVDKRNAMAWVQANRPGLWAQILCEENEVSLSEAQEEEIRGMWDWIGPHGNACDHSFDTIEEAALDAVTVLKLCKGSEVPPAPSAAPDSRENHILEIIRLISTADQVVIDGHAVSVERADYVGNTPENEVFHFIWEVDGVPHTEVLAEGDLAETRIKGSQLIVPDEMGELIIRLVHWTPELLREAWNTAVGGAQPDAGNQPVSCSGPIFLKGKPQLTEAELERYSEGNEEKLDVVLDVPWDYLGGTSDEVDQLNDYVSERITGSIADLVDIGYEVYHMTDAERQVHGAPDKHTIMLRVMGYWEPSE